MPWKETCAVEQRMAFVQDVLRDDVPKAELCRWYGISRPTGDKWLGRFQEQGISGLEDRPSVPQHHPNEVSAKLVEWVLATRVAHMTWGPRKLRAYLQRQHGDWPWPASSTIGQLLRRGGLSQGRRRRHRTPAYTQPFGVCGSPNAVWCADFKGWFRTGDGAICHPLTISDGFSRYLLRCQALEQTRTPRVQRVFETAFREYGLPAAIRTDNGSPFASKAIGGLSRLSIWWLKLGIVPERIEPGKPQQNGRHERMHLTLKQETAQPAQPTLAAQQRRFQRFQKEYNQQRPHEALGQRPPAEFYHPSPRAYRGRMEPLEYPRQMIVRSVRSNGEIKWRGRMQFLSEALVHERVGLEPIADGYWLVYFCRLPLAVLDDRRHTLWTLESALSRGWLARPALPGPFRYAPGAGQSPTCK